MKYINIFLALALFVFSCNESSLKTKPNKISPKQVGDNLKNKSSIIRIVVNDVDSILESEFMYDTLLKQKEGIAKVYHKNGKIKQEGLWHKNKQEGFWFFYDTVGNIESKANYKNDMQDGETIIYNVKGIILEKSNWISGKLDGISMEYYEDGLPKRQTSWINGKKIDEKKFQKK